LYGFGTTLACPECGARQDLFRPLFEVAMAAYFVAAGALIEDPVRLVSAVVFAPLVAVIALTDLWAKLLYPNLVILGAVLGLVFAALDGIHPFGDALLGALAGIVAVALYFALVRWAFGRRRVTPLWAADILLAGMAGAMARWPVVLTALFLGFLLGAGAVLAVLPLGRARLRAVTYGPFLCLGTLLAILWRF
jgi:prepilin signal peptidase PulO-like enzyme (type II secretory pathway)